MTMRKVCTGCKVDKPLSEFSRQAKLLDGYSTKCKTCKKLYDANFYLRNREEKIAKAAEWHRNNPEKKKVLTARYREKEKDRVSATKKEWYKKTKNDPHFRERVRVVCRNRRAREKQATPAWLSAIEIAQMQEFYEIAKARSVQTGRRYEVDHIIPLGGNLASGLHVPWNLQILSEEENLTKGTRIMEAV